LSTVCRIEVEAYRNLSHTELKATAQTLYNKYIEEESPFELNITRQDRQKLQSQLLAPSRSSFDAVQQQIFGLMATVRCE
jgi:hypothetical protein